MEGCSDEEEVSLIQSNAVNPHRDFPHLRTNCAVHPFKEDPISFFKLESDDFTDAGRKVGAMRLPTVICMEGGYAIEAVGINTVNVLEGFRDA